MRRPCRTRRWAGQGVAVCNAHPDLRRVADEVTGSNDEEGVAQVIERLLLSSRRV
ncbi:HAD hydrolase family protein [Deinococcus deserti]|uniref:HAD family hydrolase n=1 Tax=Deinococcus deserti TaxID=310783 RepID=UPI00139244FD